ncbi:hypothetical protein C8R46DRAFT_1027831 [Mycena filopes]|nr:hypothetical protein C8R46DRAFT_1027831 [Mycena filopes]
MTHTHCGTVARWRNWNPIDTVSTLFQVEAESEKAVPKRDPRDAKRKKVASDEVDEKELYSVLDMLEAKLQQHHEDTSASPEPAFAPALGGADTNADSFAAMGKTAGRPSNSSPLRPGRTTPQSSPTHEPKFSRKSGRRPAGRLAANSLFPATIKQAVGLRSSRRLELAAGFLSPDELEMNTANVGRWASGKYQLRVEEMDQWATILNYSEIAQRDGWLFVCCSPNCLPPAIVAALNWSTPITTAELRAQRLPLLADIFAARPDKQLNHLVCFHLFEVHWTVFHHNLIGEQPVIRRLNPLRSPSPAKVIVCTTKDFLGFSIEDQVLLGSFLHPRRFSALVQQLPSGKPPKTAFTHDYLGLQRGDSSTCGFWYFIA